MTTAQKGKVPNKGQSRLDVHATVLQFSARAVWLESDLEVKSHLIKMCDAVAARYGKSRMDVSIDDFHQLSSSIHKLSSSLGIEKVRYAKALSVVKKASSTKEAFDSVAQIYRVAKFVMAGDAVPFATKYLVSIATPRLKRASITYVAGLLAIELYGDSNDADTSLPSSATSQTAVVDEKFDPIFSYFNREHLCDLCLLLKISVDINASDDELEAAIVNEFSFYTKNFLTHIYHKVSQEKSEYRKILDSVCTDLRVEVNDSLSVPEIEQKIVARVFQETIDNLGSTERADLLTRLNKLSGVNFDISKAAAGGSLAALIVGNYAGFGTYLAASSALGALTSGLGVTASFGVYTSMSSAIAVALGPIGFTAATAAFIATLSKSAPRKAVPAIVYIATMRAQLGTGLNAVAVKEHKYKVIVVTALCVVSAILGYLLHFMF